MTCNSFYPLKIGYYVFCAPNKEEGNKTARAERPPKITQVVAEMQSNCPCLFRGKPDKENLNMPLFFIKLMGISILMIHLHRHNFCYTHCIGTKVQFKG